MKNLKKTYSLLFTMALLSMGISTLSAQEIDLLLKGGHVI